MTVESGAVKLTIQTGVVSAVADSATLTWPAVAPRIADNVLLSWRPGERSRGRPRAGTAAQPPGTYGSLLSAATFKNDDTSRASA